MVQLAQCLPGMDEALGLIPQHCIETGLMLHSYNAMKEEEEGGPEVQGHSWQRAESSLDSVKILEKQTMCGGGWGWRGEPTGAVRIDESHCTGARRRIPTTLGVGV